MKGRSSLFGNFIGKFNFGFNLQFFAQKRVSDLGIKIQNSLENQKLKNLVGELYREGATVGDGSAMAAANDQILTGKYTHDRNHVIKINERIRNLKNILRTEKLSSSDIEYSKKLLDDMEKSLKGEYRWTR